MGLDDFVESEVGVAVTATAALLSPRVRGVLRRGAVYGLAGALWAGDAVASAARGITNGVREAASDGTSKAGSGRSSSRRRTTGQRSASAGRTT